MAHIDRHFENFLCISNLQNISNHGTFACNLFGVLNNCTAFLVCVIFNTLRNVCLFNLWVAHRLSVYYNMVADKAEQKGGVCQLRTNQPDAVYIASIDIYFIFLQTYIYILSSYYVFMFHAFVDINPSYPKNVNHDLHMCEPPIRCGLYMMEPPSFTTDVHDKCIRSARNSNLFSPLFSSLIIHQNTLNSLPNKLTTASMYNKLYREPPLIGRGCSNSGWFPCQTNDRTIQFVMKSRLWEAKLK